MSRRIASLAIMAAVALPLLVGCQCLLSHVCVKNNTPYWLTDLSIKDAGAVTYPPAAASNVGPDSSSGAGSVADGSYDIRATFDIQDGLVCDDTVELTGVPTNQSNVCVVYEVRSRSDKADCIDEIYATLDYVL